MLLLSFVPSLACASHTLQSADETMVLILCLHCWVSVCPPPCLPVGTAPGSKTRQDAQHKLFVLQIRWRTELFFSWIHCWLSSLAAVSHCGSPRCRCMHLRLLRNDGAWAGPLEVTWSYLSEGEDCALALCSSDMYQTQKNPVTLKLSFLRKLHCSVSASPPFALSFSLFSLWLLNSQAKFSWSLKRDRSSK